MVVIFPLNGVIAKVRSKLQVSAGPSSTWGKCDFTLTSPSCLPGGSDELHGQSDQTDE